MTTPWEHRYAHRTKAVTSSTIRELLKLTERAEVISFAGGLPAPEIFPLEPGLLERQLRIQRAQGRRGDDQILRYHHPQ